LFFNADQVVLNISDKGVGIRSMPADSPERGWGLAGMRERVESVEGELQISSPVSGGTIVEVSVPIIEIRESVPEEMLHESHPPDAG
jgi:signal transduction histidine kinase